MNQIESQEKMNVATECLTLVKNEWKLIKNISLLLDKKMVKRETKESLFIALALSEIISRKLSKN